MQTGHQPGGRISRLHAKDLGSGQTTKQLSRFHSSSPCPRREMQMQIISLVKHNFFKRSFRVTLDWQLIAVLHITLHIYQLISSSCYVLYALFVAYLPALNGQFSIQQAHSSIMEVLSVSSSMFLLWKLLKSQYLRVFVKPMRVFLFVCFCFLQSEQMDSDSNLLDQETRM